MAIGSRAIDRSLIGRHQHGARELIGRFFNLVMRICTGLPFHDTQCGFKLFEARAAREIFNRQTLNGFGFDPEALSSPAARLPRRGSARALERR